LGVSGSASLSVYPNPAVPTVVYHTGVPELSVQESGYLYEWYLNGNIIPNATGQTITYTDYATQGEFAASVTDSNGCSSLSNPIAVLWTGLEEIWLGKVTVQPNPFTSEIVLNYTLNDQASLKIRLVDITGKKAGTVLKEKQSAGSYSVTINADQWSLKDGVYFIEIHNGTLRKSLKVVKM
jgi:hypothetical protein